MNPTSLCLWVGLAVSCLYSVMCGLDLAFNTYALAIKETFNFTQTEVELVASSCILGWAGGVVETIATPIFGFLVTSSFVAVMTPLSGGLIVLAVHFKEFFHLWPSLICLFQLLISLGNCIGFVMFSRVCFENFPKHHSGKLWGIYTAMTCCGKIVMTALMEAVGGDLSSFFLVWASVSMGLAWMCILVLYPFVKKTPASEKGAGNDSQENEKLVNNNKGEDKGVSIADMLRSPFFHAVFWLSGIAGGGGYVALNNITTLADSAGTANPLNIVYFMSLAIVTIRVAFGALVDKFPSVKFGLGLMSFGLIVFAASLLIAMFDLRVEMLAPISVMLGAGFGPLATLPTSVLLLRYGRLNYSFLVISCMAFTAVSASALHIVAGRLYDLEIESLQLNGMNCYGAMCFFWSFFVLLAITVLTLIVNLILCITSRS